MKASLEHYCSTPYATHVLCLCVLQAHLRFGLSTSGVGLAAVVFSLPWLPGCWWIRCFLRSDYLVAGGLYYLPIRSSHLIACGWMSCSPQRLPGRLQMDAELSTGEFFVATASPTLCWRLLRGCISLGRHNMMGGCGGGSPSPPLHVFLLLVLFVAFVSFGFRR